jgi:hypothetical protein
MTSTSNPKIPHPQTQTTHTHKIQQQPQIITKMKMKLGQIMSRNTNKMQKKRIIASDPSKY